MRIPLRNCAHFREIQRAIALRVSRLSGSAARAVDTGGTRSVLLILERLHGGEAGVELLARERGVGSQ